MWPEGMCEDIVRHGEENMVAGAGSTQSQCQEEEGRTEPSCFK